MSNAPQSQGSGEEITLNTPADSEKPPISAHVADESDSAPEPPFSIFTRGQKRWISWLASFGAMFSTLNSYIYFPAVTPMARDLDVSVALINLTITCYLVMAGLAPAFMGDLADRDGRRPVYILMFILMMVANIGIATQTSYPALFVLRMLQSAGSSGSFGAAHGVIADIVSISERGSYTGTLILFTNAAPSFGPVISGVITQEASWRWIFWFLTILTGAHGVLLLLLFPETQRKLVGNGSKRAQGLLYKNLFWKTFGRDHDFEEEKAARQHYGWRYHVPNPLACLPLLLNRGNFCVILFGGITYAVKMALQASLSTQCIAIYHLDYLQAGLVYLPAGFGGMIGAKGGGWIMDWNYRRACRRLDGSFQRGESIADFPIEKTRLQGAYWLILVTAIGAAGYGVVLFTRTHIAVMLVIQFVVSFTSSSIFAISNTMLTDLNTTKAATARGASNFVRCLLAGACIAALEPLANATNLAWCFGLLSMLQLFAIPVAWILERRGLRWRAEQSALTGQNS